MDKIDNPFILLRWTALVTWALICIADVLVFRVEPIGSLANIYIFFTALFVYGIMFFGIGIRKLGRLQAMWRIFMGITAVCAALVMTYIQPDGVGPGLIIMLSYQIALMLPLQWGILWTILQTMALTVALWHLRPHGYTIIDAPIYLGFQFFALFTSYVAYSELRSRQDLSRVNSELKATQYLLANSSRIGERNRIARELHDILGHDLTALSLNLELVRQTITRPDENVTRAQQIAKDLLGKVREIVSRARDDDRKDINDINIILKSIIECIPQLNIHLSTQDSMSVHEPGRAHTVIRCIQEVITNTLKHSNAKNLWINMTLDGSVMHIKVNDDGGRTGTFKWGNGLRGIQERLNEYGGRLTVDGYRKQGFELEIVLPLGLEAI